MIPFRANMTDLIDVEQVFDLIAAGYFDKVFHNG